MIPLTFAAGWEEVIGVSIALVIFIGNMLAKGLKKTNEASKPAPSNQPQNKTQRAQRLEELAAKRRAELQNLASQRQGQQPPTQRPANLTMQQASERDHAKTLYERRAEALRQMQQKKQHQAPPSQPATLQQHPQHQAQRPHPQAHAPRPHPQDYPSADQRKHDISQVRERETQALKQRELALKQREEALLRKAAQLGSGVTSVSHQQHGDIETVHRHIEDVLEYVPVAGPRTINALGGMKIDRQSLKQAIILKEILDPPLALRKAAQQL